MISGAINFTDIMMIEQYPYLLNTMDYVTLDLCIGMVTVPKPCPHSDPPLAVSHTMHSSFKLFAVKVGILNVIEFVSSNYLHLAVQRL